MKNVKCIEPEPLFWPGAGAGARADQIWSEPESAPGPRTSGAGATQKSGPSATLQSTINLEEVVKIQPGKRTEQQQKQNNLAREGRKFN